MDRFHRWLHTDLPTATIRWYFTEGWQTIISHAIITDGYSVGNYRWNCRRIYSVGNVQAGNFFFCARVSVCKTIDVPSVGVFLFATDLATEMGVTDDWYTNRRGPSVIILPTDFIPVTDRISPSIKLFNGVVS